ALLQRLTAVLTRYHLPTVYGGSVPALSNACLHDKKRAGSKIRLILVRQAGKAEIVPMEAQEFAALLADALPELLRGATPPLTQSGRSAPCLGLLSHVEKVGKDTPGTSWFLDLRRRGRK